MEGCLPLLWLILDFALARQMPVGTEQLPLSLSLQGATRHISPIFQLSPVPIVLKGHHYFLTGKRLVDIEWIEQRGTKNVTVSVYIVIVKNFI